MSDVDRAGRTPLHYAALENDVEQVVTLLGGGADADAADRQGFTPLHLACQQWAVDAARELLAGGASVDTVNAFGNTPLSVAVFNSRGRGELIRLPQPQAPTPPNTGADQSQHLRQALLAAFTPNMIAR